MIEVSKSAPIRPAPDSTAIRCGVVQPVFLNEISGLAASRRRPGVLWVHNDSGDAARVYAINTTGAFLGSWLLDGAPAVDWEDMALGPGPAPDGDYLYLADIGDNLRVRNQVTIYRVREPEIPTDHVTTDTKLTGAERFVLIYPAGEAHDAETLLVDPLNGDLMIVTKETAGPAGIYFKPAPHREGEIAQLKLVKCLAGKGPITAGDAATAGDRVLLRDFRTAFLYTRPPGEPLWIALEDPPRAILLEKERQGEAIGFDPSGAGFFTISEGLHPAIYRYLFR